MEGMNKPKIKSSHIKPLSQMTKSELGLYIDTLEHEIHVLKSEGRTRFKQKTKLKEALIKYAGFMLVSDSRHEKKNWK